MLTSFQLARVSIGFCVGGKRMELIFSFIHFHLLCCMQGWLRSVYRFLYFIFYTLGAMVPYFWAVLRGESRQEAGRKLRQRWLRQVPDKVGLRLDVKGTPFTGTCLYVGNHISYIDPVLVLKYVEANVVAKAEVAKWPLVGFGASIVGTIFVQRDQKSSRDETAKAIREALESGKSILVFPEGTTSGGPGTLPFRPRSFDAAHLAGVAVQPIAIAYESSKAAYIGTDTFIPHFFRFFQLKEIKAHIHFGPALYGPDTCQQARQWIDDQLLAPSLNPSAHESA